MFASNLLAGDVVGGLRRQGLLRSPRLRQRVPVEASGHGRPGKHVLPESVITHETGEGNPCDAFDLRSA